MSSNYEWQKHQARERVQARLHDATVHRQVKQAGGRSQLVFVLQMSVLFGVAMVALFFLSGCTPPINPEAATPETALAPEEVQTAHSSNWTMAARIHFQDRREQILARNTAADRQPATEPAWTMAERIEFQDRREQSLAP